MTCIVGIVDKQKGRVIIGGDSASGCNGLITQRKDDVKVFKRDDFIFGCAGDFRLMQLLRFSFMIPPLKKKRDIYEYLCTNFVRELMKSYEENGSHQKYDDGQTKGSAFLLGYKNRLFEVDFNFQIAEPLDDFYAIGSGECFAYGAMEAMKDQDIKPENKVLKALKASAKFSTTVKEPFTIRTT